MMHPFRGHGEISKVMRPMRKTPPMAAVAHTGSSGESIERDRPNRTNKNEGLKNSAPSVPPAAALPPAPLTNSAGKLSLEDQEKKRVEEASARLTGTPVKPINQIEAVKSGKVTEAFAELGVMHEFKGPNGKPMILSGPAPKNMTQREAWDYCASMGAHLPTVEEFHALSLAMGSRNPEKSDYVGYDRSRIPDLEDLKKIIDFIGRVRLVKKMPMTDSFSLPAMGRSIIPCVKTLCRSGVYISPE